MNQLKSSALLDGYLAQIEDIFPTKEILRQHINRSFICDYYTKSSFAYKLFHSKEGSVHMALNADGRFDPTGYYEQAAAVGKLIAHKGPAARVLELGCGKGFNTICLANEYSDVQFDAIDITPHFLNKAKRGGRHLPNASFQLGDYHELPYDDKLFDIVFAVETVCHASDFERVFCEAKRVLKPGGHFLLFDGYRQAGFSKLDDRLITAARLVEITMAVNDSLEIDQVLKMTADVGFETVVCEDISQSILPNLMRFEGMAIRFFNRKWLAKFFLRFFSPHLLKNAVAGLLMPITIREHAQGYYKLVFLNR